MIAVIQRVSNASITVNGTEISKIRKGLVVLLGVMNEDDANDVNYLADRITHFRIFSDENEKMNLSIKDVKGEILVVSQFTLCANLLKGRRPSFINAASPKIGEKLYNQFIQKLEMEEIAIKTGQFGSMMKVELINDGPVTFVMDSAVKR